MTEAQNYSFNQLYLNFRNERLNKNAFLQNLNGYIEELKKEVDKASGASKFGLSTYYLEKAFEKILNHFNTLENKYLFNRFQAIELENRLVPTNPFEELISMGENDFRLFKQRLDSLKLFVKSTGSYGLNDEMFNRDIDMFARYNILIEYRAKEKNKKEKLLLINKDSLIDNYIKPYNLNEYVILNGSKIENSLISKIKISYTVLNDNELIGFKDKNRIYNELAFINKCVDATNLFINYESTKVEKDSNIKSFIDKRILNVSEQHFDNEAYSDSVRAAFVELNDIIKKEYLQVSSLESDGDKLMKKVFSVDNPVFKLADTSTEMGKNIQQGYMEMFAGSIKAIRNPKSHMNFKISKLDAIEKLVIASHLLKVFDNRIKS